MRSVPAQKKPKNVLYVIGSLSVGGAERHVVSVASGLKQRGWSCSVFAISRKGPLEAQLVEEGIDVRGPALPDYLDRVLGRRAAAWTKLIISLNLLAVHLIRNRNTIVHFFLPAAYIFGGLTAWFVGSRPRIMSRRSLNRYQLKHPMYAKIERWLHPRMDCLLGNSLAVVRELEQECPAAVPVKLIYNGIDEAALKGIVERKEARAKLGLHAEALVIAIIANLIPYKGHSDLLQSLASIAEELPPGWRLLCVGRDDGIGHQLIALAEKLGLAANIVWLGPRSDVPNILSAADFAVSSSHEEGFSNSVLEAMLVGLPIVVTDVGGNGEAVVDKVTGYVVPPRNPEALGQAILAMARNPLRSVMGADGQKQVLERFSRKSCLDAYESLYDSYR